MPPEHLQTSYLSAENHGLRSLPLCRACRKLSLRSLTTWNGCIPWESISDLLDKENECRFCAFIAQSARSALRRSLSSGPSGLDGLRNKKIPIHLNLQNGRLLVTAEEIGFRATFTLYCNNEIDPQIPLTLPADLHEAWNQCCGSRSVRARGNLMAAEAWWQPLLPSRVLDIGDPEDSSFNHLIRLHISEPGHYGHYTTLSHRWGLKRLETMPLRTTRRNIEQHCKNIPIDCIPKTFSDAITVSRLLGIRYLWIDALCIVQDDENDWEEQSKLMGDIFKNSSVTLAAHSARNSFDGFLWRPDVSKHLHIPLLQGANRERHDFYVHVETLSYESLENTLMDSQLSHRAWVLQELCLSTRILHFIEHHTLWECSHQAPELIGWPLSTPRTQLMSAGLNRASSWLSLVQTYSSCEMTKSSDKLPAVLGIANTWPVLTSATSEPVFDRYFYGVFGNDICNSLLWLRREDTALQRTERAPTWSWASVDGRVQFIQLYYADLDTSQTNELQILDLAGVEASPFCRQPGFIRLAGTFVRGLEVRDTRKIHHLPFCPFEVPSHLGVLYYESGPVGWLDFDEGYAIDPQCGAGMACLRILTRGTGEFRRCYVLLLKRRRKGSDEYLRIGMGCIYKMQVFSRAYAKTISLY